jgi:hypothetical protein
VAFFVVVFAAMVLVLFEERGGDGGRPVEGARWDDSGRIRFSLGFLNIEEGDSRCHWRVQRWLWCWWRRKVHSEFADHAKQSRNHVCATLTRRRDVQRDHGQNTNYDGYHRKTPLELA